MTAYPDPDTSQKDRSDNYGFAALVAISWNSPDGSNPIRIGSGVLVSPRLVVTARHVVCLQNEREASANELALLHDPTGRNANMGTRASCVSVRSNKPLDLALLRLDKDIPAPGETWMKGGPKSKCVPADAVWRGFGIDSESGNWRACQQGLDDPKASFAMDRDYHVVRIQIEKGLGRGWSGGPVFLECGGRRLFAGIGKMGGEDRALTVVLPTDEILAFLEKLELEDKPSVRTQSADDFFSELRRRRNRKLAGAAALIVSLLGLGRWSWTSHEAREQEKARQVEAAQIQAETAAKEEAARSAVARASEEALDYLRAFALSENSTLPLFGRLDRASLLEPITNNPANVSPRPLYQELPLLKQVKKEDLIRERTLRPTLSGESPDSSAALPELTIRAWEEAALRQSLDWDTPAPVEGLFGDAKSPPRFVVVGPPGSGKSTFLRALAYKLAKGQVRHGSEPLTPIQIELRDWESWFASHGGNLADYLTASIAGHAKEDPSLTALLRRVSLEMVNSWLEGGRVCVLLDGLDEIRGDQKFTALLEANLKTQAWSKTPVLLACRTLSFETHQRFCPGFAVYCVGELTREQRDAYVRAYPPRHPASFQAELLLGELDRIPAMEPLWGNPMLLSLICYAVDTPERISLPTRRTALYDRVVEQLLAEWEQDRPAELRKFDRDDLLPRRVLERVALDLFTSWDRARKLSFGKEEFNAAVVRSLAAEGVDRSIAGPLQHYLTGKPGLLRRSREGDYTFLHLTLHEFLVGSCLARLAGMQGGWESGLTLGAGSGTLNSLVDAKAWDPAWREVLLFMSGSLSDPAPLLRLLADATTDSVGRPRLCLAIQCRAEVAATAQRDLDLLASTDLANPRGQYDAFKKAFPEEEDKLVWVEHLTLRALTDLKPGRNEMASELVNLSRNTNSETRISATRALGQDGVRWANEAVLPRLLELTRDTNAWVRAEAARTLGRLGYMATADAVMARLLELSLDSSSVARSEAANALVQLSKTATTELMLARLVELSRNMDRKVREVATSALGQLGEKAASEQVLARLVDMIRDPPDEGIWRAADALGQLGGKSSTEPVLARLVELSRDTNSVVRSAAARALYRLELSQRVTTEPMLARLVELSRNMDAEVRVSATRALGRLGEKASTEPVFPRLVELTRDADARVRAPAALALGKLGGKAATEPVLARLLELSRDSDFWVRHHAASAVGELALSEQARTEPMFVWLVELSRNTHGEVRMIASSALGRLGEKSAIGPVLARLVELSRDSDSRVMDNAVSALGQLGAKAATEPVLARLVDLTRDPKFEIRYHATHALGELGEGAATEPVLARLVEMIWDKSPPIRDEAAWALRKLTKKAIIEPILGRLVEQSRSPDHEARKIATRALGLLGERAATESVLARLVELIRDPNAEVRGSSVSALQQLGAKAAAEPVLTRLVELSRDSNAGVCRSAVTALGQLGEKASTEPVLTRLVELSREPNAEVRGSAIFALGQMGEKAATGPILARLVEVSRPLNSRIAESAAMALCKLSDAAASEAVVVRLLELSRHPGFGIPEDWPPPATFQLSRIVGPDEPAYQEVLQTSGQAVLRLHRNGLRWFSAADGGLKLKRVETLTQWPRTGAGSLVRP